MSCAHCCFSCTGEGTFMSRAVFQKCLDIAVDRSQQITLGGGEPTLHPNLIEWATEAAIALLDVTMDNDYPSVLVITNGKKSKPAQILAKMSRAKIISAELSRDLWHEEIDPETVAVFQRYAEFRDVTRGVLAQGRAFENDLYVRPGCACPALFITPSGDFYGCGCQFQKLGNILTDPIPETYWENRDECANERKENEVFA